MQAASRLVAFAALLGLLAPSTPFDAVQTWIHSSRRRAARTEADEHSDVAVSLSESPRSPAHEMLPLGPFIAAAADRLLPPAAVAHEPELQRAAPLVRFDRARPPARAPPHLA